MILNQCRLIKQPLINHTSMLSTQLLIFVFICGIIIASTAIYGIYTHLLETVSEFEAKRESKISYRTNEEFVGR
jgi:hypothetical protein